MSPIIVRIYPFVLSVGTKQNTTDPIKNNIIGNYVALNPPILSLKYPYPILTIQKKLLKLLNIIKIKNIIKFSKMLIYKYYKIKIKYDMKIYNIFCYFFTKKKN